MPGMILTDVKIYTALMVQILKSDRFRTDYGGISWSVADSTSFDYSISTSLKHIIRELL